MTYNHFLMQSIHSGAGSACRWICCCGMWEQNKFPQERFRQGHNNIPCTLSSAVLAQTEQGTLLAPAVGEPKGQTFISDLFIISYLVYYLQCLTQTQPCVLLCLLGGEGEAARIKAVVHFILSSRASHLH